MRARKTRHPASRATRSILLKTLRRTRRVRRYHREHDEAMEFESSGWQHDNFSDRKDLRQAITYEKVSETFQPSTTILEVLLSLVLAPSDSAVYVRSNVDGSLLRVCCPTHQQLLPYAHEAMPLVYTRAFYFCNGMHTEHVEKHALHCRIRYPLVGLSFLNETC